MTVEKIIKMMEKEIEELRITAKSDEARGLIYIAEIDRARIIALDMVLRKIKDYMEYEQL